MTPVITPIAKILSWVGPRRRKQFYLLATLTLGAGFVEYAVLALFVVFLNLITARVVSDNGLPTERGLDGHEWLAAIVESTGFDDPLLGLSLVLILATVISAGYRYGLIWLTTWLSMRTARELSLRSFSALLRQPYAFHLARNSSEAVADISKVDTLVRDILTPALNFVVSFTLSIGIIASLLAIDWKTATVAALSFGLIYLTIIRFTQARLAQQSRIVASCYPARFQVVQEALGGIRDTILDASQSIHIGRLSSVERRLRSAQMSSSLLRQTPRFVAEALGILVVIVLAIILVESDNRDQNALATVGALGLGAQKLLPLFQRLYAGWSAIVGNIGSFEDVAPLLEQRVPEKAPELPEALRFSRQLKFDKVGFRYGDELPWIFRDLDLTIERGTSIGISGTTGRGKSTLLDLIMGLLSPTSGSVKVDGVELSDELLPSWQRLVAHVPQEVFLTDLSLRQNIALGVSNEDIDQRRIEAVTRAACLDAMIKDLPEGLETLVGERGVRLSGGQRQRIGIARALYKGAEVLILDEATSALDAATESVVLANLAGKTASLTVIMVAHRLSTLENCDVRIEL